MEIVQSAAAVGSAAWGWIAQAGPNIVSAILILVLGWIGSAWAGRWMRRLLERAGRLDATVIPVISSTVRYALLIIVLVASLGQLGIATTSILAALGAAGLAIGLALQGTLSNIAAGIMLLWLRPFRAGDYIDAEGIAGSVREIGLFATELETFDGIYRFVPNGQLWNKPVFNYSRNKARMTNLVIGISYGANIKKARRILLDLAGEDERVAADPSPVVFVDSLDDSAVTLRFRVWIASPEFWGTLRYLLEEGKRRLDEGGIEIPFPQRVVHIVSDDPPAAGAAEAEKAELPRPVGTGAAARVLGGDPDD